MLYVVQNMLDVLGALLLCISPPPFWQLLHSQWFFSANPAKSGDRMSGLC